MPDNVSPGEWRGAGGEGYMGGVDPCSFVVCHRSSAVLNSASSFSDLILSPIAPESQCPLVHR
jgi:hypothetical protein